MGHYSEDDLILYFYGEHRRPHRVSAHLETCQACAADYRTLGETLALVEPDDVPARGDFYGLEVWQRVRPRLPARHESSGFSGWFRLNSLAAAAALATLLIAAFVAGRTWPRRVPSAPPVTTNVPAGDPAERARLVDIGDHLERSERVLLDVMNAPAQADAAVDITVEQGSAEGLLEANRLYRDAAMHAGDQDIAQVLDDLERSLLEVVHGPASLSPDDLQELQARVAAAALLFRVRVLANELRDRVTVPDHTARTVKNRTTT